MIGEDSVSDRNILRNNRVAAGLSLPRASDRGNVQISSDLREDGGGIGPRVIQSSKGIGPTQQRSVDTLKF
ncbi:MAG: hypothetical protein ABIS92_04535 [Polyangia bacterium]